MFDPDVLLLDEPLSNLDARLREEMRFELRLVQSRVGVTAVFVTHDQAEAMVVSDRTIVMSTGRVEQVGSPSEIYEQPATRFVMDFVGQVNHLPGRATRSADGTWVAVVSDAGGAALPLEEQRTWNENDEVVLAFRPQAATLRPTALDSDWVGTVQTVAYFGTHVEYLFRLGGADIRVVGPCQGRLAAGDRALCDIDRAAVRAWPAA
ncbi:MAG: ABC transporter ATP-binding protein [Chloroflexi bacterium]|nr:ABC transporter ATP-binding protein [Chloroflexota bacterium]